jgi:hypothetical protein
MVIGSGSVSFEIVRSLVDRSPLLLMPRWVVSRAQPIGIEDVVAYLLAALDVELEESRLFEIGGPDQVAYADLMREYARQVGLRRAVIRVPFATPRISGLWLSVVTPVYASIGRGLIESLRNDTLVGDGSAREVFPIRPRGFRQAIARALANEDREFAETRWSDALSTSPRRNWGGVTFGQRAVASRTVRVAASPQQTFAPIQRIGGKTGWYYANGFWRLRGLLDNVVGGVGLRRGRRDPVRLSVGDTLDFWRVEAFEQDRLLRLSAEMKSPGRIWLQFEVDGNQAETTLRQTAIFDPHGLAGLVYWYALYPIHYLIFEGMLRRIGQVAITSRRAEGTPLPELSSAAAAPVGALCDHCDRPAGADSFADDDDRGCESGERECADGALQDPVLEAAGVGGLAGELDGEEQAEQEGCDDSAATPEPGGGAEEDDAGREGAERLVHERCADEFEDAAEER